MFFILFVIMAQAQLDLCFSNGCSYCEKLLLSAFNWQSLDSTLSMYNYLKKEVEFFEGALLCPTCHLIINRKIKLLKRIDPLYAPFFQT